MLATLAECNMHILTSKSQQRVICDTQIYLGHTDTDALHIFRAARVKAELRKQTGNSVPKARNLNDSASNNIGHWESHKQSLILGTVCVCCYSLALE